MRSAGVVLAAGSFVRMGMPKQLLEVEGRPMLEVIVANACASRGLMEDVSRRMVAQMADGIRDRMESAPAADGDTSAVAVGEPRVAAPAKPINAIGLLFSIIAERIRGWFRR